MTINSSYFPWVLAFIFMAIDAVAGKGTIAGKLRNTTVLSLIAGAILVKGFAGWGLIVLAETALLIGTSAPKKQWGLIFSSLIPGVLVFVNLSDEAISGELVSGLILLFIFLRCVDWPLKSFGNLSENTSEDRCVDSTWGTIAYLFLLSGSHQEIVLPALIAFSLLNLLSGRDAGIAVFSWLGLTLLKPEFSALGIILLLGLQTVKMWRFSSIILFSVSWYLVDWRSLGQAEGIYVFVFAALTSISMMTSQKKRSSLNWVAFTGAAAVFLFVMSRNPIRINEIDIIRFSPFFLAVVCAAGGLILYQKGLVIKMKGIDWVEKLNAFLTKTTIMQEERQEKIADFVEADRPSLGEVGQFVSWIGFVLLVVVVGQWLT